MRTIAVRLPPGADLKAELQRLVEAHGLKAACILTGIGSLTQARLRMPSAPGEPDDVRAWREPLEIVALAGTLSPDGLHLHAALARRDGSVIGGHLMPGCLIHTTAELVIGELDDVEFRRPLDPATGYPELSVEPRARTTRSSFGRRDRDEGACAAYLLPKCGHPDREAEYSLFSRIPDKPNAGLALPPSAALSHSDDSMDTGCP